MAQWVYMGSLDITFSAGGRTEEGALYRALMAFFFCGVVLHALLCLCKKLPRECSPPLWALSRASTVVLGVCVVGV